MRALYREFVLRGPTDAHQCVGFMKENAGPAAERGKPLRVVVTAEDRTRTVEQNARYWGRAVLGTIADQVSIGGRQFDAETWHENLAEKFCPRIEFTKLDGTIVSRRKSTSEMGVKEFSEYVERVEIYAATELGVEFDR
jgi:hypothetical protein